VITGQELIRNKPEGNRHFLIKELIWHFFTQIEEDYQKLLNIVTFGDLKTWSRIGYSMADKFSLFGYPVTESDCSK
jgi:hypothetical protein